MFFTPPHLSDPICKIVRPIFRKKARRRRKNFEVPFFQKILFFIFVRPNFHFGPIPPLKKFGDDVCNYSLHILSGKLLRFRHVEIQSFLVQFFFVCQEIILCLTVCQIFVLRWTVEVLERRVFFYTMSEENDSFYCVYLLIYTYL